MKAYQKYAEGINAIIRKPVDAALQAKEKGITPDVFFNGHIAFMNEDAAKHNDELVNKYFYRIRNL